MVPFNEENLSDRMDNPKTELHLSIESRLEHPVVTHNGPLKGAVNPITTMLTLEMERRRAAWFAMIGEAFREVERTHRGFQIEELAAKREFITLAASVTEIAVRNHRQEKLDALKNLLVHFALASPEDESLFLIFAHLVDRFSTWHMRILALLNDPKTWAKAKGMELPDWSFGTPANLLEYAFPELEGGRHFYDVIVRDLYISGMTNSDTLHRTVPFIQLFDSMTTPLGRLFIRITSISGTI